MLIKWMRYYPFSPRQVPSDTARSEAASVTSALRHSSLLKRTYDHTVVLVMFTCLLLASHTNCVAEETCSIDGTVARTFPCKRHTHNNTDGKVQFESIVFTRRSMSFNEGKALCEHLGMSMGTPWSPADNAVFVDLIKKAGMRTPRCWIGISDEDIEGEWRYVSGPRRGRMIWKGDGSGK
eukprot:Tbor_TRINITY_DN5808_c0_g3::TRINITY_DN5808_c0_g3_i1::g.7396::m.7396